MIVCEDDVTVMAEGEVSTPSIKLSVVLLITMEAMKCTVHDVGLISKGTSRIYT